MKIRKASGLWNLTPAIEKFISERLWMATETGHLTISELVAL